MSTFASLLANPNGISAVILQRRAEQDFVDRISRSVFHHRSPTEPIPSGRYVVIGVATYSRNELALLDEIACKSQSWRERLQIDVFDTLECKSMRDFDNYFPGIKAEVETTPVLGVWNDRQMTKLVTGLKFCRDELVSLIGLNEHASVG